MNRANAFESYAPREGFYMRFANGHGVSVVWHDGAYADGGKTTAEIMAPFSDLAAKFPGSYEADDDVLGHVTPDEIVCIMGRTAALPKKKEAT